MIKLASLENLILVRMLSPTKNGLTPQKVSRDLFALQNSCTLHSWEADFASAWQKLLKAGLLIETRRRQKGLAPAILSDQGQQAARAYLGISNLPDALKWGDLKNYWLVAKSLGLKGPSELVKNRVKSGSLLQSSIVALQHQLNLPAAWQAKHVWDTLFWKCLGVERSEPFTLKAVQLQLLKSLVGVTSINNLNDLKGVLAATAIKARRKDLSELRQTLLSRLLSHDDNHPQVQAQQPISNTETQFHIAVKQAANSCQTGLFGADKLFISHLWREISNRYPEHHCSLEQFKQKLLELNRQGMIQLCRADLIEALDQKDLSESRLIDLGSSFHFIRLGGG